MKQFYKVLKLLPSLQIEKGKKYCPKDVPLELACEKVTGTWTGKRRYGTVFADCIAVLTVTVGVLWCNVSYSYIFSWVRFNACHIKF